ncbi:MAG: hypothetical protein M1824_004971 [Vezdaea acicularis]|nr:MAG: hypothetical protein M1824_004971 [Vezdaea acicularis]
MKSSILLLPLLGVSTLAQYLNASDAIHQIPSLSLIAGFVDRDPTISAQLLTAQNITIFASNNDALTKLANDPTGKGVTLSPASVHAILQYWIVEGVHPSSSFTPEAQYLHTALTDPTFTNVTGGQVLKVVEGPNGGLVYSGLDRVSNVVQADITFPGGVIHVIDTALDVPENITFTGSYLNITSVGVVNAAGFIAPLEPFHDITIFAFPTNATSFSEALPGFSYNQSIEFLSYLVLNGTVAYSNAFTPEGNAFPTLLGPDINLKNVSGQLYVNEAKVVRQDVLIAQGVLHALDRIIYPPGFQLPSA